VYEPVVYDEVVANSEESLPSKSWALSASDADIAFEVVPLIVAVMVPITVKSPVICPEPETIREPDIIGSNIFILYNII